MADTQALTLERLFASPPLAGPTLSQFRFAPEGQALAWLQTAPGDGNQLDLWLGTWSEEAPLTMRCLVAGDALSSGLKMTEAEKARRERLRLFFSGITEFHWRSDGQALRLTLDGVAYELTLADDTLTRLSPEDHRVHQLTSAPGDGRFAYVHEGDLWLGGDGGAVRQLTREAADGVVVGLPDFIAAEEMHRQDAFWFSPDGRYLAFLKADETPIPETLRFDATEAGIEAIAQRYPFTGGPNATLSLGLLELATGTLQWLPWQAEQEDYLARVTWAPTSDALYLQRQPRNQRRLTLLRLTLDGTLTEVHEEHSESWVNLHDDFRPLRGGGALWSAERGGPRQLYRLPLREDGPERRLTPDGTIVHRVLAVQESRGEVLFEGTLDDPTARHILRGHLDGRPPVALTDGAAWHQGSASPDGQRLVILRESATAPPEARFCDGEGTPLAVLADNPLDHPDHAYAPYLAARRTPEIGSLFAEDGQALYYRLTRPAGDGPFPVILAVYGGPGAQRVTRGWPPLLHQVFVQQGWAVLELDNRGSAGRGEAFERPIQRRLGEVEVRDQFAALDHFAAAPWFDEARVAVFGHSYGGFMALRCLAEAPHRFRAAVSVAPVTDWTLYDTHYTERYLETPQSNPEGYEASGVLGRLPGLAQAPGALLLVHGMADDNVLFTHSTRLMAALQQAQVPFEMMAYPGAKHAIAGAALSGHRYGQLCAFLARRFTEDAP